MLTTFAHAGHTHTDYSAGAMTGIDHCVPIIIGASLIIAVLSGVIIYLLAMWRPKTTKKSAKK